MTTTADQGGHATPARGDPDAPKRPIAPGEPYCSSCGYPFTGLTDAAACPECGRPIVEVLARMPATGGPGRVRRYRSGSTLWGLPLVDVAFGPRPEFGERVGKARGIIALGDVARGGIAVGGQSIGVVAVGGFAVGVAAFGGSSFGLLTALGGFAVGGLAVGGGAVGVLAQGGGAAGWAARGGGAAGYYAQGGGAVGVHTITGRGPVDPEAVAMFDRLSPVLGSPAPGLSFVQPVMVSVAVSFVLALAIAVIALAAHRRAASADRRGRGGWR